MSVGLLRVLAQQKLISKEQFESYEAAANSENGKDVISSVIGDKIIDAMGLAELFSNLFGYPIFDLTYYPQGKVVNDVLSETQMLELRCVPLFKRGNKIFLATSDPTQLQQYQKAVFHTGLSVEPIIVCHDQLVRVLEFFGSNNSTLLQEMVEDSSLQESQAQHMIVDGEEEEDGPVARFIQKILYDALKAGASDIHFEFYEFIARVRYRLDCVLR